MKFFHSVMGAITIMEDIGASSRRNAESPGRGLIPAAGFREQLIINGPEAFSDGLSLGR
jgi:hypothetical protein